MRGAGRFERTVRWAGFAVLLVGMSFVRGAVEEDEPRAARTGLVIFGAGGVGLMLLAWIAGRSRHR